jgi:hypothetical protein
VECGGKFEKRESDMKTSSAVLELEVNNITEQKAF